MSPGPDAALRRQIASFLLAGDTARALGLYRLQLALFAAADPEFDEELGRVRARVAELEAEVAAR